MKKIILTVTLFAALFVQFGFAQNSEKATLVGKIINDAGQPLDFANILLLNPKDSSLVKGTISDSTGAFIFEMVENGSYLLSATMVGYPVYRGSIEVTSAQTVHLPTLQLRGGVALSEVAVVAQKPFIEMQNDKIVMNVENSAVAAGNTALEVLQKAPGVLFDQNSRALSLKGKQGVLVMIDGKQSYLSTEEVIRLLETMPANNIEKIEIIHNPSAKYDAAGNAGIINIRLKKDKNLGFNGNVSIGGGYWENPTANGSTQLNYRRKKFNLFGNYSRNYREQFNNMTIFRSIPFEGAQSVFDQDNRRNFLSRSNNFKAGVDFYLTKNTTIGALMTGGIGSWRDRSNIFTQISGANNEPFSQVRANTNTLEEWDNRTYNLNFRHAFNDKGAELTFDADYSTFDNPANQQSDNFFFNNENTEVATPNLLRSNSFSGVTIKAAKVDWTQPLKGGINLEAGLKTSIVGTDNDVEWRRNRGAEFVVDTNLTNQFLYEETIYAGYVNASTQFKGFSVQAGLRGEQTVSDGRSVTLDKQVKRDYLSLFPSLSLSHQVGKDHSLSYSYSRRIDRPSYQDLNPFTFFLDQYTFGRGNPFLRPQFTNAFSVNYSFKQAFVVTASYSQTDDAMTDLLEQNDADRTTYQTRANFAKFDNWSLNVSTPIPITKWWSARLNLSGYINHFQSTIASGTVDNQQLSYNAYMSNNFTLSKTLRAELSGWYNSPNVWGLFEARSQYAIDAGLFKSFWKDKASLKLNISDIFFTNNFRVKIQQDNINARIAGNWESRRVNLSFSYKFGNTEMKPERRRATATEDEKNRVKNN